MAYANPYYHFDDEDGLWQQTARTPAPQARMTMGRFGPELIGPDGTITRLDPQTLKPLDRPAAGGDLPVSQFSNAQAAQVYDGGNIGQGGPTQQGPAPQAPTPQQRVMGRAQIEGDARLANRIGQNNRNPWDMFGMGGGDWASAWQNANRPTSGLFGHLAGQMLAGPQTSGGLAGLFNSAAGPYGQMQAAAAYTAPSRHDASARRYEADTQRDVAKLKYGTAGTIARQLMNMIGGGAGPMTGLSTDYGASAQLKPVDFRRFFSTRK